MKDNSGSGNCIVRVCNAGKSTNINVGIAAQDPSQLDPEVVAFLMHFLSKM